MFSSPAYDENEQGRLSLPSIKLRISRGTNREESPKKSSYENESIKKEN